jgi:hypothetical protein
MTEHFQGAANAAHPAPDGVPLVAVRKDLSVPRQASVRVTTL